MVARPPFWVNWKNPMMLSDEHFRQADASQVRARQWLAQMFMPPGGGYGLTSRGPSGGQALELRYDVNGLRLDVVVEQLAAMAPDGTLLIFDFSSFSELRNGLQASFDLEKNPAQPQTLAVIVEPADAGGEDASSWTEVGEPSAEEEPPRAPFRVPALRLLVEENAQSRMNRLRVAELIWDGAAIKPNPAFLPPSRSTVATVTWQQKALELADVVRGLRIALQTGVGSRAEGSLVDDAMLLAWLTSVSAAEEAFPAGQGDANPREIWHACRETLRVGASLLHCRNEVRGHVEAEFVQPGKAIKEDTQWFGTLERYLAADYDHEEIGHQLMRAGELLRDLSSIVSFLLGNAPQTGPTHDPRSLVYHDVEYKRADYRARVCEDVGGAGLYWCHLTGIDPQEVSELVLVLASSLEPAESIRSGLKIDTTFNKHWANFPRYNDGASYDRDTLANETIVHISQDFRPPGPVGEICIMSFAFELTKLGPNPDELLRVYVR